MSNGTAARATNESHSESVTMQYISTRSDQDSKSFCEILLEGLAPDGGLYTPAKYPTFSDEELAA